MRLLPSVLLLTVAACDLSAQATWTSFSDRRGHAVAAANGQLIMFGGESVVVSGKYLDDTSALSFPVGGPVWSSPGSNVIPPATTEHAMAPAGILLPEVVMFGGRRENPLVPGTSIPTDATFVYTGGDWSELQIPPGTGPSPRSGHAMVTNATNGNVILFGGLSPTQQPLNDLWEFDAVSQTWSQLAPAAGAIPSPRFDHCMAFFQGRVYVFGGSGFLNDTWYYDVNAATPSWTDITIPAGPSGRAKAAMAYVPFVNKLVLFGGVGFTFQPLDDTWTLDSAGTWTQESPATSPPARYEHALTTGPTSGGINVVLTGGTNAPFGTTQAGDPMDSTWSWVGNNWLETLAPPPARTGVAMAYDTNKNQHIMFGGVSVATGLDSGETWDLTGFDWHLRTLPISPSARSHAGMCFDSGRNRMVLFGGRLGGCGGTLFDQTWEWDGFNWILRNPTTSPPAIAGVPIVFDSKRNLTWLLAGQSMWWYDGSTWHEVEKPTARFDTTACFDPTNSHMVMFGGRSQTVGHMNDVWERNSVTGQWRKRTSTGTIPYTRNSSAMVFDSVQQVAVVVGGNQGNGTNYSDTYTYTNGAWVAPLPAGAFPGRFDHGMAYDVARDRTVLFGGVAVPPGGGGAIVPYFDTYEFDGATWSLVTTPTTPTAPFACGMAYDPIRQVTVLFGGEADAGTPNAAVYARTWEYDGVDWTEIIAPGPSPRRDMQMAFDPSTGKVLMFGGNTTISSGNMPNSETWLWDGATWQQQFPAHVPGARHSGIAVTTTSGVLMGFGLAGSYTADLWRWQNNDWTCVDDGAQPVFPPTRTNYGMAYDSYRDRIVMFGGVPTCGGGGHLNDTWEWDPSCGVWTQMSPALSPVFMEGAQLAYDEARRRIVMYGGSNGTTLPYTWEWDGFHWMQRQPIVAPPPSTEHGFSYDPDRKVTVAYGTLGTWDYGPETPPTIVSTPTSQLCVGSNGSPTIAPLAWSGPWLGESIELTVTDAPLINVMLMMFGFNNQTYQGIPLPIPLAVLGSPTCQLNISADVIDVPFPATNPYVSIPMPTSSTLIGAQLFAQAGFLDFGQAGVPFITSNSLAMTLAEK